ncbi:RHS repeat domain-containing protein [Kribbella albertanoniae]|uniref:RHS repeat protein n=1 Tax=Kribbella albertanoniae TaxID=1266829 RepID=A0A4V2XRB8_9ACTN|nr:RHS repeat-associated core domain-containing protein [Kribbella albertanoniae]TDC29285.1 RHS repeat protein [Kribbella albertanoniae]
MSERVVRGGVACLVGLTLVAGTIVPAGAVSPPVKQEPLVKAAKVKSVSGKDYKPIPRKPDLNVDVVKTPTVTWPAAGTAEVAVPEPTWAARLSGVMPKSAAGVLPVSVGPAKADGNSPSSVKVDLLGRQGSSVVVKLTNTDKSKAAGKVSLELNYEAFRHAYGGDWATRLQLVDLPTGKPIPTRNTGSGKLSADVPATGVFAMQAAASGPAGDFGATALAPSASWSVGGSSGDFNWQYPMRTPPGTGGPTPQISLGYSSGGVDGRTSSTNNQTSWAGEGFDLAPGGSIERRYASCGSKSEKTGNNGTRPVGDLCFATDNATFSLNGKGGELVRDDQTGQWRPKGDDGTKVERLQGAVNGDQGDSATTTGEHWRITGKDGTQYYFGLNKIPSPNAVDTNSTWVVPVAGNHAGEQCHQAAFANSFCNQAYKWNLDYVVDPHGNTMSLFYETEKNNYAYNGTETTVKSYDRAGHIKRIDYGQTAGQVFSEKPVARVHFDTTQRCVAGINCAPADFLDTPTDQECSSTTRCTKFGPSFFTKTKLSKVRTEVLRGTTYDTVDSYTFRHSFPNPGDNTSPRLWLEAITHAGEVGTGAVSMPEVNFDKVQLNNRVADGSGQSLLDWFRIKAIHYGTGGELSVSYSAKDCSLPGNVPPVDDNHRRCYPVKWTPPGAVDEREDWFHKYVVTSVVESDRVTGMVPVMTTVTYPEGPSWRHDDEDGLVEIGRKTWSQWRGYERVVVTKGHPSGTQSVTEHRYFQGMDGDKLKAGGVKDVQIEDSTGAKVDDLNSLAGQERETSKLVNGAVAERTITDSWVSPPTATRVRDWGTTSAFQVEQKAVRQWTAKPGGGFQETAASNEYTSTGVLTASSNANDLATTADDTCTRFEYASNATKGIAELPTRTQTVAKACDQPWTKDDVVSDQKQSYQGGAAPENGKPIATQRLSGFTSAGAPTYQTVKLTSYDDHGRKKTETDAKDRTSTFEYFPADGPVTKTTATLSNGHSTSTDLDPAWGQSTKVTDVAGRVTVSQRDPIGRISKVWLPGRAQTATPNVEHIYHAGVDAPNVVQSKHLQSDGSVETRYEVLDGLQRKRQVQQPAADGIGRVVTDIEYDSRGLQIIENSPYYNDGPPGIVPYDPVEEELPARKATEFDEADRPTKEAFWSLNQEKWFTTHTHEPDRQTVNPPTGEQATTKISDAQGRPVELRTYNTPDPSTNYAKTSYTYTKSGQLASVTDPAGNQWRYSYDLMGRRTKVEEPDRGTSLFTYNELDQVTSSTDGRGTKLFFTYDEIGRQLEVREGSETGPLRIERTYDNLAAGSPSTATRWVNGNAYKTEVTGYDVGGQPLGTKVTIPASEGALAKTYEISATYTQTGQPKSLTMPGVGGLPAETLTTGYDANEVPKTLSSELGSYVTDAEFNSFGDLTMVELQPTGGKWLRHSYVYDEATRRITRAISQRETTGPQRVLDQSYTYDHAGNVTKIIDAPASGSTDPADTQCFDYDESRRLTQAWTPSSGSCAVQQTSASQLGGPAPYWHQWTFDAIGNRKTEKRTATAGVTTSTYDYPATGQPRPHAVQKITTSGPSGTKVNEYGYDAMGNQTSRTLAGVGESFDFDAEGKLAKVTKGDKKTEYIYDADGNRLLRKDSTGTTLYLGSTELLLMPDGSQLGTRHYTFGKQTIGVRVGTKLTWLGSDHHGSATLMVDAETQAYQRKRITPYGEARGAVPTSWPGQKDFVGGTRDDSTGLVHLGAREYDPTSGRFISVDPVVDPEDPQQLNAYAYANNSPVSFVDADGKRYRVETVTELKTIVRQHVKRIVELQKEVITVYVKIVIWTFISRLASIFGLHSLAVKSTAEVARQVTIWKQVVKTIRYHTKEVIRIVTKRFIKLSGTDAAEMKNALNLANSVEAGLNNQDRSVDALAKVAKGIGDRARAAQLAAAKNEGQNQTAADKEDAEGRENAEDLGKSGGRALGGTLGGFAGRALGAAGLACGPMAWACVTILGAAGGYAGTKVGGWLGGLFHDMWTRPKTQPDITRKEYNDLCSTPGAQEACKWSTVPG